jgi:curved DNA-binding protein CbpA
MSFAAPSGAADDPATLPPPPGLAAPLVTRWKDIQARAATIDQQDFFEMLGIERSAPPPQIQNAYFQLAKAWHPDKLPAELAPLRALVSKCFTRFNEAFNTLNDPVQRTDYLKTVEQGGGSAAEAEQVARVVDAAFEFQKGEVMLKKGDLNAAEAYIRRAAEADPEQVEYRCTLAWISALKRGDPPVMQEGKVSTFYRDIIATLDDILKTDAMYERALFYRATLLKRSGDEDRAIRDFRMVVQVNPKNVDAVRELRLYQMRREKKAKDQAGPLGIGKLFKK